MNVKLKNAVLNQLGVTEKEMKKYASDYMNAENGLSGFIYYSETFKFTAKNHKLIVELLEELADDQGIEVVEMVKGFGVFRNNPMDNSELKTLYTILSGNKPKESDTVTNVLAWLCVEQLAFELDE